MRPELSGRRFAHDIFKCISVGEIPSYLESNFTEVCFSCLIDNKSALD